MKQWNLESPAAAWLLHAGLFAAVSAVVWFGERAAPPVPAWPAPVQWRAATPAPPAMDWRHPASPMALSPLSPLLPPSAARTSAALRAGCVTLPTLYELSVACAR